MATCDMLNIVISSTWHPGL